MDMHPFDWHDWCRVLNLSLSAVCVYILGRRFGKKGADWNAKTRDYWFALVMWSVAGVAMSLEGILRNSVPGTRLLFICLASLVTLRGLLRRGTWGDGAH